MDTICFTKQLYGIPCPSCGFTRSFLAFFRGDFQLAFQMHPLFVFVPFLIGFFIWDILSKTKYFTLLPESLRKVTPTPEKFKKLYLIFLILLILVYILRMFLFFPDTPPLDFHKENWLLNIF
jgi:hypothetical protein